MHFEQGNVLSFKERSPPGEGGAATGVFMKGKWIALGCLGLLVLGIVMVGGSVAGIYNRLVTLDEAVRAQWGQVENVYQRRLDLIPNLVATVKGAADFERDTFTAVTEARAKVGRITGDQMERLIDDPEKFRQFEQAQAGLSSALSRLLVTVERYPDLKATQNFRDLQAQLEGTENRIAVERMRYNEQARAFNTYRQRFPANFVAGLFGDRFAAKPYFKATEGAETPPAVDFGK